MKSDNENGDDHDQFGALYRLWEVFLHMRAWGVPEYTELSNESRIAFTEMIETGTLFTYVEDCKRDLLRSGFQVPDAWLSFLCASRIKSGMSFPQSDRDNLGAIIDEMYPWLVRLDPDSQTKAVNAKPTRLRTKPQFRLSEAWPWPIGQAAKADVARRLKELGLSRSGAYALLGGCEDPTDSSSVLKTRVSKVLADKRYLKI